MKLREVYMQFDIKSCDRLYEDNFDDHVTFIGWYVSREIRRKKIECDSFKAIRINVGGEFEFYTFGVPYETAHVGVGFDRARFEAIKGTSDCSYYIELLRSGLEKLPGKYAYIVKAVNEAIDDFVAGGCITRWKFRNMRLKGIYASFWHDLTTNDYTFRGRFIDLATKEVLCEGAILRTIPYAPIFQYAVKSVGIEEDYMIFLTRFNKRLLYIDINKIRNGTFNYQFFGDDSCASDNIRTWYYLIGSKQYAGDIDHERPIEWRERLEQSDDGTVHAVRLWIAPSLGIRQSKCKVFANRTQFIGRYVSEYIKKKRIKCPGFSCVVFYAGGSQAPCIADGVLQLSVGFDESSYRESEKLIRSEYKLNDHDFTYLTKLFKEGISCIPDEYADLRTAMNHAISELEAAGWVFKWPWKDIEAEGMRMSLYYQMDQDAIMLKGRFVDAETERILCDDTFLSARPLDKTFEHKVKDAICSDGHLFLFNQDGHPLLYASLEEIREGRFNHCFYPSPTDDEWETKRWYTAIEEIQDSNVIL